MAVEPAPPRKHGHPHSDAWRPFSDCRAGARSARRLRAFAEPALPSRPRGVDLRLERFSELMGVSHPDPRIPQPVEESPRLFAIRGVRAIDAYRRAAPSFLRFRHGRNPGTFSSRTRNVREIGSIAAASQRGRRARIAGAIPKMNS